MVSNLSFTPPIFFSHPFSTLIFGLAALGATVRKNAGTWWALSTFLSFVILYSFISSYRLHGYGPRFLFESLPIVAILAARGISYCIDELFSQSILPFSSQQGLKYLLVAVIFISSFHGLKEKLVRYYDYNGIDPVLFKELERIAVNPAIILVRDTSWQSLDIGAKLFDPSFKKFIMVKENLVNSDALRKLYPNHVKYSLIDGKLQRQ
jgi:hypothetical protein